MRDWPIWEVVTYATGFSLAKLNYMLCSDNLTILFETREDAMRVRTALNTVLKHAHQETKDHSTAWPQDEYLRKDDQGEGAG